MDPVVPSNVAYVLTWLMMALPIMAGLAMWRHWRGNHTDTPAVLGMMSAAIWTIWVIVSGLGLVSLPQGMMQQFSIWASVFLFITTLYDWIRSMVEARVRGLDLVVMAMILTALGCAGALWMGL